MPKVAQMPRGGTGTFGFTSDRARSSNTMAQQLDRELQSNQIQTPNTNLATRSCRKLTSFSFSLHHDCCCCSFPSSRAVLCTGNHYSGEYESACSDPILTSDLNFDEYLLILVSHAHSAGLTFLRWILVASAALWQLPHPIIDFLSFGSLLIPDLC
jgi:hypothetical protein